MRIIDPFIARPPRVARVRVTSNPVPAHPRGHGETGSNPLPYATGPAATGVHGRGRGFFDCALARPAMNDAKGAMFAKELACSSAFM